MSQPVFRDIERCDRLLEDEFLDERSLLDDILPLGDRIWDPEINVDDLYGFDLEPSPLMMDFSLTFDETGYIDGYKNVFNCYFFD